MPGNEATLKHNALRQTEHDRLPVQISRRPEGKWGMKQEPDNKGRPRAWYENHISATYYCIRLLIFIVLKWVKSSGM